MRPNSPPQITSVSFQQAALLEIGQQPATGLSVARQ
jgi:hypothetical protein